MLFVIVILVISLLASPLLMWLAARIVRVRDVGLRRVFVIYGLLFPPLIVGHIIIIMFENTKPSLATTIGVGELVFTVWLIKRMFRINLLRAGGIFLLIFILNLVVGLGIRWVAVEAFIVPTGGMEPTIMAGDRILADKVVFRFRNPCRDEVVVFHPPHRPDLVYVRRIIGIEGDNLTLSDDIIHVNGKPMGSCLILNNGRPDGAMQFPIVVPPGKLFMLGDNRAHSMDSRYWGFADVHQVVGRATVIYASTTMPPPKDPLERHSPDEEFKMIPMRWERIGKIVR